MDRQGNWGLSRGKHEGSISSRPAPESAKVQHQRNNPCGQELVLSGEAPGENFNHEKLTFFWDVLKQGDGSSRMSFGQITKQSLDARLGLSTHFAVLGRTSGCGHMLPLQLTPPPTAITFFFFINCP